VLFSPHIQECGSPESSSFDQLQIDFTPKRHGGHIVLRKPICPGLIAAYPPRWDIRDLGRRTFSQLALLQR